MLYSETFHPWAGEVDYTCNPSYLDTEIGRISVQNYLREKVRRPHFSQKTRHGGACGANYMGGYGLRPAQAKKCKTLPEK
jgi:hypothetical protein